MITELTNTDHSPVWVNFSTVYYFQEVNSLTRIYFLDEHIDVTEPAFQIATRLKACGLIKDTL